jgi:ornithine carbamoyltransferase
MKRDFLHIVDFSSEEIQELLDLAVRLKKEYQEKGENPPLLKGKVLGMIFQKPSLRTRVSFDMAMRHLGGDALYLSPQEIGLGKREAISDVARVLSGYVHAIMARVFEHEHVLELARWASVPVINGLSDYNHPCQAMADALTIQEVFGKQKGLNITFVGDGNNVAVSLMHVCVRLGWNFTIATPEGYDLNPRAVAQAQEIAAQTGSRLRFFFFFFFARSPRSGAGRGCDLYGHLDQHGAGGRGGATRKGFPTLSGECATGKRSPAACHRHALPARPSRPGIDRRGRRRPTFCDLSAGP